jgi:predicted O-linked N-acetylglucosamine transferase (SPINDLY family)
MDQFQEAAETLDNIIQKKPNELIVYDYAGKALNHIGQHDKAISALKAGLQKHPSATSLIQELATSYLQKGDIEQAIGTINIAIEKEPTDTNHYLILSTIYIRTLRFENALQALNIALQIDNKNPTIINALGATYSHMGDNATASKYFLQSARIDPTSPEPLLNLALCFGQMEKADLSLKFYDEVLKLDPNNVMALCAKASVMCDLGMSQEALPLYKKGLNALSQNETKKNYEYLTHHSNYIMYLHYSPESTQKEIFQELIEWQKQLCKNITENKRTSFNNTSDPNKKLRIGYISGGFVVHPVGQMTINALKNIDKAQFETYIYSDVLAPKQDYMTDEFREVADEFIDITSMQNAEITDLMHKHGIDILIEMTGYSHGGKRLPIAAARAAPVQVKWVGGLFNTTGLPQMDWIIGDKVEIPDGEEKWYTESVYRMPDDYIIYNPPFYAPDITPLPAEKNGFVTFGNLNNLAKTNSYSIALWSKILHTVPDSKLLLKTRNMDTEFGQDHVRQAFASHGISDRRLIFEGGEKHQAFMNVYNRIDIALDPYPYTGGLTTCEALWMGVPVVTLPGETFAGKHAETHLTTAGLEDWIATSDENYVAIAKKWATDIPALAKLRSGLRDKVAASPLVDSPRFAKNFEIAMRHMWKDWCDLKQKETK